MNCVAAGAIDTPLLQRYIPGVPVPGADEIGADGKVAVQPASDAPKRSPASSTSCAATRHRSSPAPPGTSTAAGQPPSRIRNSRERYFRASSSRSATRSRRSVNAPIPGLSSLSAAPSGFEVGAETPDPFPASTVRARVARPADLRSHRANSCTRLDAHLQAFRERAKYRGAFSLSCARSGFETPPRSLLKMASTTSTLSRSTVIAVRPSLPCPHLLPGSPSRAAGVPGTTMIHESTTDGGGGGRGRGV